MWLIVFHSFSKCEFLKPLHMEYRFSLLCSDTCDPNMRREDCSLYAFRHQIDLTSDITAFDVRLFSNYNKRGKLTI